jgi:hypothetical protein
MQIADLSDAPLSRRCVLQKRPAPSVGGVHNTRSRFQRTWSCNGCYVTAYTPLARHDFFAGAMGAAAALTGLLFAAISFNP